MEQGAQFMQNAAHAYLQTQVGTTGRGEIIVMLYDGALRFLAQAREKMEARDMAGKGMLISVRSISSTSLTAA